MVAQMKTEPPQSTARPELDAGLGKLRENATAFARSSIEERLALLRQMQGGYMAVAEESVLAGCRVKGIDPGSALASEEWLAGPSVVVRNLRLLIETLERLARNQAPFAPERIRTADGRAVVDAFPASTFDKLLFAGFSAEVWMKPGVKADAVEKRAAAHYRTPPEKREGK